MPQNINERKQFKMKKFLKSIYQFFLTIHIFKSTQKVNKINKNKFSFFFIKSLNEVKTNKIVKRYFKEKSYKLNRFKKKSKFFGLKVKNEIICSGWIYFGNKWNIEEINKDVNLNNQYLLYDFLTEKKFRNMGHYTLLLKIIQNKFRIKKLIIYSLSHNKISISAIKSSGFKFIKKIKKY